MKVFYHNDNDGKCAAHLVYLWAKNKQYNIEQTDFYPVNYNDKVPTADLVEKGEEVYIVDYSFTETTVSELLNISFKAMGNVYWFDHHKTSLEVEGYIKSTNVCKSMVIDVNRSGTLITYDELIKDTEVDNDTIKEVVKLVDDYDRWIHAYPESKLFNSGSTMFPNGPFDDIWHTDPGNVIEKGKFVKEYNDIINLKMCNHGKYFIKINDKRCIVLNTPIKSSDVFNEYFEKYRLAIRWSFDGEIYNYSIYSSRDDVDCSAIAKYFDPNGGGHKGAAGFRSKDLKFKAGYSYRIKNATIPKKKVQ